MPLQRGRAVGRYIVVDKLGAGGMGVVYRAFDPDLDRSVALKLVGVGAHTGIDATAEVRDRLLREAQAMAQLNHPNVITVYDVGLCDADGRASATSSQADLVYVAMELVEGWTLKQWLVLAPRSLPEILEAFVQAGRGLAAAHAAGLMHRDFKPDNVMIGRDAQGAGRVRVLDFGLARALGTAPFRREHAELDDLRTTGRESLEKSLTAAGSVMGTPAYMSPEQHLASPIDARSDQFSFCVALFEAVYGQRPFAGDTIAALAFNVLKGAIAVPDGARRPPAHVHDAIVRGLQVDPNARHRDMDALVLALTRDPAATRRRRLWLAIGAFAMLAGGTSLGVAIDVDRSAPSSPTCTAAQAELDATWNDARRQAIADAFAATGLAYAPATWSTSAQMLDATAAAWVAEHTAACRATRITGEQSEAAMDKRIACLDAQRRDLDALLRELSRVDTEGVRRAIDAVRSLPDPTRCATPDDASTEPTDPDDAARVAALREAISTAHAALALGRFAQARDGFAPWNAVVERTEHLPTVARARALQAEIEKEIGDPKLAIARLESAMWAATSAGDDRFSAYLARRLTFEVGYRLHDRGAGERWLAHGRALVARIGGDAEMTADLATAEGAMLVAAGQYEAAIVAHGLARDYWQAQDDAEAALAGVLLDIAAAQVQLGRTDEAIALDRRVVELHARVYGEDHPQYAGALRELGSAYAFAHEWDAALEPLRRALAIQRAARGEGHIAVATLLDDIGRVLRKKGDLDGSIDHHVRALAIWEERLGDPHVDVAVSVLNVGYALTAAHRRDEALAYYRRALAMFEATVGERHAYVVYAENAIGAVLVELGRHAEARPHLERVLALRDLEVEPTLLAETRYTLAHALWTETATQAERTRARELAKEALDLYRPHAARWQPQLDAIEAWLRQHA